MTKKKEKLMMKCPYCNSENIEDGFRMFEELNGSPVGFRLKKGFISVVSPIHCSICKDCQSIVRSYIHESPNNK